MNGVDEALRGLQIAGMVNFAEGNHGVQIACSNLTQYNRGLQIGFFNSNDFAKENFLISDYGFNYGFSIGGYNHSVYLEQGAAQVGIFNTASESSEGYQVGILNATRKLDGYQIGGINIALERTDSDSESIDNVTDDTMGDIPADIITKKPKGKIQAGIVNIVNCMKSGLQTGIVNYATKGSGLQLGLLNIRGSGPWYSRITPGLGFLRDKKNS